MKMNVEARLFMPGNLQYIGGSNPAIAEFKGEVDVNIATPKDLELLLAGLINLDDQLFRVTSCNRAPNLLTLLANVQAEDMAGIRDFLETLKNKPGWQINDQALAHYRVFEQALV